MYFRKIQNKLSEWAVKDNRKPLILRGARQVGKTTVVREFSKKFNQYIELNLDKPEDKQIFVYNLKIRELIEAIFFYKNQKIDYTKTLIFIDEIQNSPEAVRQLRYFYEEYPQLYIIAAGSLLESLIDRTISFPVGRVEYMYMFPFTFDEFVTAYNADLIDVYNTVPIPEYANKKFESLFSKFALIGGMPEIVANYLKTGDLIALNDINHSLLTAYKDDIEKYSQNNNQTKLIRFVFEKSFFEAGKRLKYTGFGNSNYKSDQIREVFEILEKALILKVIYPTVNFKIPIEKNLRKSPKLLLLDTGLVNYAAGLQKEIFSNEEIIDVNDGFVAEHIVAQELNPLMPLNSGLNFWVREKKQSNAEIDFVIPYKNLLIPIEVKTGKSGRLRSLHQFIDNCPHNFAVRIYSGKFEIQKTQTIEGKMFNLMNLPFFLIPKIYEYLDFMIENKKQQTCER